MSLISKQVVKMFQVYCKAGKLFVFQKLSFRKRILVIEPMDMQLLWLNMYHQMDVLESIVVPLISCLFKTFDGHELEKNQCKCIN